MVDTDDAGHVRIIRDGKIKVEKDSYMLMADFTDVEVEDVGYGIELRLMDHDRRIGKIVHYATGKVFFSVSDGMEKSTAHIRMSLEDYREFKAENGLDNESVLEKTSTFG